MSSLRTHPVDVEIGRRLEAARRAASLTASDVGRAVGVSKQQVRKYETAASRVAVSTLADMARALGRPIAELVDGLERLGDGGRS